MVSYLNRSRWDCTGRHVFTFPTAASPSSTSLTLLLGFGCAGVSAIVKNDYGRAVWVERARALCNTGRVWWYMLVKPYYLLGGVFWVMLERWRMRCCCCRQTV